jgi:hypothetical protein
MYEICKIWHTILLLIIMYNNELEKNDMSDSILKWLISIDANACHLHELS